jgi:hypothetical protein
LKEYDPTSRYAVFIKRAVDPDPIRIQGFDDLKKKIQQKFVLSQIAIILCQSFRRSLQLSLENMIQHFKK